MKSLNPRCSDAAPGIGHFVNIGVIQRLGGIALEIGGRRNQVDGAEFHLDVERRHKQLVTLGFARRRGQRGMRGIDRRVPAWLDIIGGAEIRERGPDRGRRVGRIETLVIDRGRDRHIVGRFEGQRKTARERVGPVDIRFIKAGVREHERSRPCPAGGIEHDRRACHLVDKAAIPAIIEAGAEPQNILDDRPAKGKTGFIAGRAIGGGAGFHTGTAAPFVHAGLGLDKADRAAFRPGPEQRALGPRSTSIRSRSKIAGYMIEDATPSERT
jgi:hypothetical protein